MLGADMKLQGRENSFSGKIDLFLVAEGGLERHLGSYDDAMEAREAAVDFRNSAQTLVMMAESVSPEDLAAEYANENTIVVPESPEE